MSEWFSPVPYEYNETRLILDFGLSSATKHYNDKIVPKIGSVRRLRSFSYALAGIKLYSDLKKELKPSVRPSHIAHALEALANKIHWNRDDKKPNDRILGVNGFKKHPDEWGFENLLKYYVKSNTMRQSSVAALRNFNLVKGSTYNSFTLEPQGELIAELFLKSFGVKSNISGWIKSNAKMDITKISSISPDKITDKEIEQIVSFLNSEDPGNDCRRKSIWELFKLGKPYKELLDENHKNDILMVESYELFKIELTNFYLEIALNIGSGISKIKISKGKLDLSIKNYEENKLKSKLNHPKIEHLLNNIKNKEVPALIGYLLEIEHDLIRKDENNRVQQSSLFSEERIKSLKRDNSATELPRLAQIRYLIEESKA